SYSAFAKIVAKQRNALAAVSSSENGVSDFEDRNILPNNNEALQKGLVAFHQSDFAAALNICRSLAEKGDVTAEAYLGVLFEHGMGVRSDFAEAVRWYRKSAEGGSAVGQIGLAAMYDGGHGVQQDYEQAIRWFR